jgi:hypothetical protein
MEYNIGSAKKKEAFAAFAGLAELFPLKLPGNTEQAQRK